MYPTSQLRLLGLAAILVGPLASAHAQPITVTVQATAPGKAISPDLVGIFFEDLSHSADGGLYAELVQNRDFEYSAADNPDWNALTSWQVVLLDDSKGTLTVEFNRPLHANTAHYAVLTMLSPHGQVGLRNEGFDGIPVNGLRADLAQAIADLKPKFMRFPGGCLVHGDGLDNFYNWKDTVGPIEQRKGQRNIWKYHQTVGLGYFEYFQFCEDIGAKPIPIVPAGVSCQNTDARFTRKYGIGQECLPLDQMPAYIQDVLDLIEWANGPVTSAWGAKRAAAGHPAPFGLQYLGIGNEDKITPGFRERFKMIYDAVKAKHPEITVIGTVGPNPDGADYDNGWKIADELRLPMVDEHSYKSPQWLWENVRRFDAYDRAKSKVYLGEWAAFDDKRRSTLRSAIAEAAYLTGLERNADVVSFASYAPLLAKRNHTHWSPNLIYFSNTEVFPTINYHVQQLFSVNNGDVYLPTAIQASAPADFAASTVKNTAQGAVILKLVNGANASRPVRIELTGANKLPATAEFTVLAGPDANAVNDYGSPRTVLPRTTRRPISAAFDYEAPANSLTVIRITP